LIRLGLVRRSEACKALLLIPPIGSGFSILQRRVVVTGCRWRKARRSGSLEQAIVDLGDKGASDGLEADDRGWVFAGDYERDGVRQRQTNGEWRTIAQIRGSCGPTRCP
jgi:hypothetical protein